MAKHQPDWQERRDGSVWILHSKLKDSDSDRLQGTEYLTVWNVKFPPGFLGNLPNLQWLDMRGGSATDLDSLNGCTSLRGLEVNQVRGLADLTAIEACRHLEYLMLYGLAQVRALPDLVRHTHLRRVSLGQLRNLADWSGLTHAPALKELYVSGKFDIGDSTVQALADHPSLELFEWELLDAPLKRRAAVVDAIGRPPCKAVRIDSIRLTSG